MKYYLCMYLQKRFQLFVIYLVLPSDHLPDTATTFTANQHSFCLCQHFIFIFQYFFCFFLHIFTIYIQTATARKLISLPPFMFHLFFINHLTTLCDFENLQNLWKCFENVWKMFGECIWIYKGREMQPKIGIWYRKNDKIAEAKQSNWLGKARSWFCGFLLDWFGGRIICAKRNFHLFLLYWILILFV